MSELGSPISPTALCAYRGNSGKPGTETSAEVLVGPPGGYAEGWSRTPVHSSGTRLTLTLGGGPREGGTRPRPVMAPYPFPGERVG